MFAASSSIEKKKKAEEASQPSQGANTTEESLVTRIQYSQSNLVKDIPMGVCALLSLFIDGLQAFTGKTNSLHCWCV